jgi:hypothetical protein
MDYCFSEQFWLSAGFLGEIARCTEGHQRVRTGCGHQAFLLLAAILSLIASDAM